MIGMKYKQPKRIIETRNQILPVPIVTEISENNPQSPQELLQLIKLLPINPNSPIKVVIITKRDDITEIFLRSDDSDRNEDGSLKSNFNIRESMIILTIKENGQMSVHHAHILNMFTDWIIPDLKIDKSLDPFTQPWGKHFFKELQQFGIDTRNIVINENPLEVIQGFSDYI